MTEITRVPIKPIARGAVPKLWLGIVAAVLLAAGLAYAAMPKGVSLEVIAQGSGPSPAKSDVIFVRYTGKLAADGTVFDQSRDVPLPIEGLLPKGSPLPLSRMIPGFAEGAAQMKKGGKYTLFIPAAKGYGAEGSRDQQGNIVIPPNADLEFDVELIDFMSEGEFEGRIQALQQAMQMQGGGAGPAPAPEGPAPQ